MAPGTKICDFELFLTRLALQIAVEVQKVIV